MLLFPVILFHLCVLHIPQTYILIFEYSNSAPSSTFQLFPLITGFPANHHPLDQQQHHHPPRHPSTWHPHRVSFPLPNHLFNAEEGLGREDALIAFQWPIEYLANISLHHHHHHHWLVGRNKTLLLCRGCHKRVIKFFNWPINFLFNLSQWL